LQRPHQFSQVGKDERPADVKEDGLRPHEASVTSRRADHAGAAGRRCAVKDSG
jgi:hypothetical protein